MAKKKEQIAVSAPENEELELLRGISESVNRLIELVEKLERRFNGGF